MLSLAACAVSAIVIIVVARRRRGTVGSRRLLVAGLLFFAPTPALALASVVAAHTTVITTRVDIEIFSELGSLTADTIASLFLLAGVFGATRAQRSTVAP
jgi:hypothetical protein